jgi:hypothetical protein
MDKIFEKLEKLKKLASPDRKGVKKVTRAKSGAATTTAAAAATADADMDTSITDRRHRMTEQEEDEELMDNDDINEEDTITRFDASPWCKLHF